MVPDDVVDFSVASGGLQGIHCLNCCVVQLKDPWAPCGWKVSLARAAHDLLRQVPDGKLGGANTCGECKASSERRNTLANDLALILCELEYDSAGNLDRSDGHPWQFLDAIIGLVQGYAAVQTDALSACRELRQFAATPRKANALVLVANALTALSSAAAGAEALFFRSMEGDALVSIAVSVFEDTDQCGWRRDGAETSSRTRMLRAAVEILTHAGEHYPDVVVRAFANTSNFNECKDGDAAAGLAVTFAGVAPGSALALSILGLYSVCVLGTNSLLNAILPSDCSGLVSFSGALRGHLLLSDPMLQHSAMDLLSALLDRFPDTSLEYLACAWLPEGLLEVWRADTVAAARGGKGCGTDGVGERAAQLLLDLAKRCRFSERPSRSLGDTGASVSISPSRIASLIIEVVADTLATFESTSGAMRTAEHERQPGVIPFTSLVVLVRAASATSAIAAETHGTVGSRSLGSQSTQFGVRIEATHIARLLSLIACFAENNPEHHDAAFELLHVSMRFAGFVCKTRSVAGSLADLAALATSIKTAAKCGVVVTSEGAVPCGTAAAGGGDASDGNDDFSCCTPQSSARSLIGQAMVISAGRAVALLLPLLYDVASTCASNASAREASQFEAVNSARAIGVSTDLWWQACADVLSCAAALGAILVTWSPVPPIALVSLVASFDTTNEDVHEEVAVNAASSAVTLRSAAFDDLAAVLWGTLEAPQVIVLRDQEPALGASDCLPMTALDAWLELAKVLRLKIPAVYASALARAATACMENEEVRASSQLMGAVLLPLLTKASAASSTDIRSLLQFQEALPLPLAALRNASGAILRSAPRLLGLICGYPPTSSTEGCGDRGSAPVGPADAALATALLLQLVAYGGIDIIDERSRLFVAAPVGPDAVQNNSSAPGLGDCAPSDELHAWLALAPPRMALFLAGAFSSIHAKPTSKVVDAAVAAKPGRHGIALVRAQLARALAEGLTPVSVPASEWRAWHELPAPLLRVVARGLRDILEDVQSDESKVVSSDCFDVQALPLCHLVFVRIVCLGHAYQRPGMQPSDVCPKECLSEHNHERRQNACVPSSEQTVLREDKFHQADKSHSLLVSSLSGISRAVELAAHAVRRVSGEEIEALLGFLWSLVCHDRSTLALLPYHGVGSALAHILRPIAHDKSPGVQRGENVWRACSSFLAAMIASISGACVRDVLEICSLAVATISSRCTAYLLQTLTLLLLRGEASMTSVASACPSFFRDGVLAGVSALPRLVDTRSGNLDMVRRESDSQANANMSESWHLAEAAGHFDDEHLAASALLAAAAALVAELHDPDALTGEYHGEVASKTRRDFGFNCGATLETIGGVILLRAAQPPPTSGTTYAFSRQRPLESIVGLAQFELSAAASSALAAWLMVDPAVATSSLPQQMLSEFLLSAASNVIAACGPLCVEMPSHTAAWATSDESGVASSRRDILDKAKARHVARDAGCLLLVAMLSSSSYALRARIFAFNTVTCQRLVVESIIHDFSNGSGGPSAAGLLYLLYVVRSRPSWFDDTITLEWAAQVTSSLPGDAGLVRLALLYLADALLASEPGSNAARRCHLAAADVQGVGVESEQRQSARRTLTAFASDEAQWRAARSEAAAVATCLAPPRIPSASSKVWDHHALPVALEGVVTGLSAVLLSSFHEPRSSSVPSVANPSGTAKRLRTDGR